MAGRYPEVLHTYQNHILDSTRWASFVPRHDDIVIATSYKSGTTWTQAILNYLILGTASAPDLDAVSPWLEARFDPLDMILHRLATQTHRRFIKTHLALDGLPFHPRIKYLVVGRDARDVFMSLWNHHSNYLPDHLAAINALPGRVGPELPAAHGIHAFWRDWITRGWFSWEREGYPYWGNLHHTATWWAYRGLDNILFVHFNDLLHDLPGEIRRIADFLTLSCAEETVARVAQLVTFEAMRRNAAHFLPTADQAWTGGARTFLFRGTNGRWAEVLSAEERQMHAATVATVLTPPCADWLEQGRAALP